VPVRAFTVNEGQAQLGIPRATDTCQRCYAARPVRALRSPAAAAPTIGHNRCGPGPPKPPTAASGV